MPLSDDRELPANWIRCDAEQAATFERELKREMPKGHTLHNASVEAVARDQSRDNVLFSTGAGKFAMVHLTWRVETAPSWPWTSLYDDYDSWKAEKDADFDEFDDN